MKLSWFGPQHAGPWVAAVALAAATAMTSVAQEYVVDSQVISDHVVGRYEMGQDGCYVGDLDSDGASGFGEGGGGNGFGNGNGNGNGGGNGGNGSGGDCIARGYGRPDLFYNYYTQGNCNTANAQLYLSPLPIPPNVGHTFYTYQPFYPHHYLYWHKDRYHNYYDNGRGMNRTRAVYYAPPIHTAISNFYWNKLRLAR